MTLFGMQEITEQVRLELKHNYAKKFDERPVLELHACVGEEHGKYIQLPKTMNGLHSFLGGTSRIGATVEVHATCKSFSLKYLSRFNMPANGMIKQKRAERQENKSVRTSHMVTRLLGYNWRSFILTRAV